MSETLTDEQLQRYSRQLLMPEMDVAGQLRLTGAQVLVVGAGGLGCPIVLYLAAAGVGNITVADADTVELANLQRQIAFGMADLGRHKAEVLAERAMAINPDCRVVARVERLAGAALEAAVEASDLVLDASDNFATRFAVNAACVKHRVPLVSGAAIRAEGQVAVFDSRLDGSPCYRCLYAVDEEEALNCSQAGVIGPLVGMIGTTQAMEAIKVLAGVGTPLTGQLLLLDALAMQWRSLKLPRDPGCPVCGVKTDA